MTDQSKGGQVRRYKLDVDGQHVHESGRVLLEDAVAASDFDATAAERDAMVKEVVKHINTCGQRAEQIAALQAASLVVSAQRDYAIKSNAANFGRAQALQAEVERLREALDLCLPLAEAYVMQAGFRDPRNARVLDTARDALASSAAKGELRPCVPCDGRVSAADIASCGFGRCPHKTAKGEPNRQEKCGTCGGSREVSRVELTPAGNRIHTVSACPDCATPERKP